MSKSTGSFVTMSKTEQILGFLYLLLEIFALPSVLIYLNALLPAPLSAGWLNFLYFALNFIFTCALFHGFLKRNFARLKKDFGVFVLITVGGFGVYYVINLFLGVVIRLIASDFANLNDGSIIQMVGDNRIAMIIGAVLLAPVAEELLYRGLVFGSLKGKSLWAAYLVSTILFAVIHVMGYIDTYSLPHLLLAFVQYLPAGLVLAWTYHKSGNILSPIVIHIAVNTLAILSLR